MTTRQRRRQLADVSKVGRRCGKRATHAEQGVVADDSERRLVVAPSDSIPPAMEQLERREASRIQSFRAFYPQVTVVIGARCSAGPAELFEQLELLGGPVAAAEGDESLLQRVAQGEQVLRVGGGIGEHRRGKGPEGPVGLLMLLVQRSEEHTLNSSHG